MTVSAFMSLSLKPPLIAVCLANTSRTLVSVRQSSSFAVSVLSSEQGVLSQRFAFTVEETERFVSVETQEGVLGCPLIVGAAAHLECALEAEYAVGDHTLCVGAVRHAAGHNREPLVYFSGAYRQLVPPA
jgi:flavin reductase (DIM6/NTAB) family NADH-FMN oxidoreductase RutF